MAHPQVMQETQARSRESTGRTQASASFPPSAAFIVSLASRARIRFDKRDKMIDQIRDERFLRKKPIIPPAYRLTAIEVRAPIVNDQLSRLVGNLTANPLTITVPPPKLGPIGQQFSSKLEKAAGAMHARLNEDAGEDHEFLYMDMAVETGEAAIKILYRPDRWDTIPSPSERRDIDSAAEEDENGGDLPENFESFLKSRTQYKKMHKLPIARRIVDRRNLYYWRDEDGIARLLEITQRPLDEVYQQFREDYPSLVALPLPYDADLASRKVTMIEYWDREWTVVILVDGIGQYASSNGNAPQVLRAFRHGYPRIPYFIGLGEQTSSTDPNYEAMPSAYPILYLAPFINSLYTMWANIGYLVGYPSMKQTTKDLAGGTNVEMEDSDEAESPVQVAPGTIVELPPGTDLDPINYGVNASAITAMVGEMRNVVQSAMLPSIMQGVPPGSRTAGYAISELAAAAKAKYQTIVRNAERAWAESLNFCLWLVEHKVQEPVYLMANMTDDRTGQKYRDYLELRPNDIKDYLMAQVKIQPRNAIDRIQESTYLANMKAAGAASTREIIEKGRGEEQPDEIVEEIMVERALEDPQIQQFMHQAALRRAGLQPVMEELQAAAQMFQAGVQQARGMMGGGGGANGMQGGLQQPGAPTNQAPTMPGMNVPGMPNVAGQGQQLQPNGAGALPRQYLPKGASSTGAGGRPPGARPTTPVRPSIEGFRSR